MKVQFHFVVKQIQIQQKKICSIYIQISDVWIGGGK